jgi:hypothetical protein
MEENRNAEKNIGAKGKSLVQSDLALHLSRYQNRFAYLTFLYWM